MDIHRTNPSSYLPSLKSLQNTTSGQISTVLDAVANLYNRSPIQRPRSRLQKLTRDNGSGRLLARIGPSTPPRKVTVLSPDSGYASAEDSEDASDGDSDCEQLTQLRNDPFERSFVVRWLTGFIARADEWTYVSDDGGDLDEAVMREREELVEKAANILSICATGNHEEGCGDISRKFNFPFQIPARLTNLIEHGVDTITVELNDAVPSEKDHNSVGLQSWASSIILSQQMAQDPARFGLDRAGIRILELGAGTGLLSITAAKVLETLDRSATIVATDYHQEVLSNLRRNVENNFDLPPSLCDPVTIDVHALDWESPRSDAPFDEPYDIILAADVIYNPLHAKWIKNCVERYLRRPTHATSPGGVFWLAIPVRTSGRHEGVHGTVDATFPSAEGRLGDSVGQRLEIIEWSEIAKCDGVGRADETGYRLFKIGWSGH